MPESVQARARWRGSNFERRVAKLLHGVVCGRSKAVKVGDGYVEVDPQHPPAITYERGVKKVHDRDLAYGGGFTAKRAVLYLSMGSNKFKLVYVKTPVQARVNPNNMTWSYQMADDGIHFTNIQRYQPEEWE